MNGLALCALHHKLFARRVFTLTDSPEVHIFERAEGGGVLDHRVVDFNGQAIPLPQRRG